MKKYKIGMYGGKFLPFHKGHKYCIEFAAHECEKVYVILFLGGADEEKIQKNQPYEWLSAEERIKQLNKICKEVLQYSDVYPVLIDITKLRLPDGSEDWDAETPLVRNIIGNHLDAVYSSEKSYDAYFKRAYPEAVHRLVDVKREHYPISGTQIRKMKEYEREIWIV